MHLFIYNNVSLPFRLVHLWIIGNIANSTTVLSVQWFFFSMSCKEALLPNDDFIFDPFLGSVLLTGSAADRTKWSSPSCDRTCQSVKVVPSTPFPFSSSIALATASRLTRHRPRTVFSPRTERRLSCQTLTSNRRYRRSVSWRQYSSVSSKTGLAVCLWVLVFRFVCGRRRFEPGRSARSKILVLTYALGSDVCWVSCCNFRDSIKYLNIYIEGNNKYFYNNSFYLEISAACNGIPNENRNKIPIAI